MSNSDLMQTDLGEIYVPGWDEMVTEQPHKALTLQAMANLEIRAALQGADPPKQLTILNEVIRLGGKLSPTSQKVISENIHKLIEQGHVVFKEDYTPNRKRGRGGPTSPWRTKYVAGYLRSLVYQSPAEDAASPEETD